VNTNGQKMCGEKSRIGCRPSQAVSRSLSGESLFSGCLSRDDLMDVGGELQQQEPKTALGLLARYLAGVVRTGLEDGAYALADSMIVLPEPESRPVSSPAPPRSVVTTEKCSEKDSGHGVTQHWVEFRWSNGVQRRRARTKQW